MADAADEHSAPAPPNPKKRKQRAKKEAAATAAEALLPTLGAFLMLDNNEALVDADLVEAYVRDFMAKSDVDRERHADLMLSCIASGNIAVIRALMMCATSEPTEKPANTAAKQPVDTAAEAAS